MIKIDLGWLDVNSIQDAIDRVNKLNEDLNNGIDTFCTNLVNVGLNEAQTALNTGSNEFASNVRLHTTTTNRGLHIARHRLNMSGKRLTRTWYTSANPQTRQQRTSIICPVSMVEFGSGQFASNPPSNLVGYGGRGTHPTQTHAFSNSWSWYDNSGARHRSSGNVALQPMEKALVKMMAEAPNLARRDLL